MTEQEQDERFKECLSIIDQWAERNKPPTLWEIIRNDLGYSIDLTDEIVDAVERWLPKEHDTNGYGWNSCIKMLKDKLQ